MKIYFQKTAVILSSGKRHFNALSRLDNDAWYPSLIRKAQKLFQNKEVLEVSLLCLCVL